MIELLIPVDWNEWKRRAEQLPVPVPAVPGPSVVHGVAMKGHAPRQVGEAERVALMVLSLGQHSDKKKEAKIVRMALRDIEQAVLSAQQDIDYL